MSRSNSCSHELPIYPNCSDSLYPIRLEPVLKRAIWGGRKIESFLGKPLPLGNDYAESWEVSDHRLGINQILYGRFAGESLHFLVEHFPEQLLGIHKSFSRFPLLMKILDANHQLSVQVHPDDQLADTLQLPDGGKDEAWVILESTPESFIYTGFQSPVTEQTVRQAIDNGTLESLLYRFHPEVGQSIYLPAGTVHSLGAGVLVAEIQQSSDHTFRLFDWNRRDSQGKLRDLHVEHGLRALLWNQGKVKPDPFIDLGPSALETLVACDKFIVNRQNFVNSIVVSSNCRAHIIFVVKGAIEVEADPAGIPLSRGSSIVLPAGVEATHLTPVGNQPAVILNYYVP